MSTSPILRPVAAGPAAATTDRSSGHDEGEAAASTAPAPLPAQTLGAAQTDTGDGERPANRPGASLAVTGVFIILLLGVLQYAKDLLLPIALAMVLALVFSPVVRFLGRLKVPSGLAAVLILIALVSTIGGAFYSLSGPLETWIERAPGMEAEVREKLKALREPLEAMQEAEKRLTGVAGAAVEGGTGEAQTVALDDEPREVVVQGPGYLQSFALGAVSTLSTVFVTLILLTFLLASGDMFYAKLVQGFDKMSDKKKALSTAHNIERTVSRYLFTISIINVGLGVVVGAVMYVLGMPTPWLWGALATLLNFIPYVGALAGLAIVSTVGFVSFDTLGEVFIVAAAYFACTTFEGQVITPIVVGRRLELNAVAVFLAVAFWAWVWGIVGALIAVPMLVIFKTIADRSERWNRISNFLADD